MIFFLFLEQKKLSCLTMLPWSPILSHITRPSETIHNQLWDVKVSFHQSFFRLSKLIHHNPKTTHVYQGLIACNHIFLLTVVMLSLDLPHYSHRYWNFCESKKWFAEYLMTYRICLNLEFFILNPRLGFQQWSEGENDPFTFKNNMQPNQIGIFNNSLTITK